jgi:hypothetical protein
MTKKEMRKEFEAYFHDLKAEATANGYRVNKADEWALFQAHIEQSLTDEG